MGNYNKFIPNKIVENELKTTENKNNQIKKK